MKKRTDRTLGNDNCMLTFVLIYTLWNSTGKEGVKKWSTAVRQGCATSIITLGAKSSQQSVTKKVRGAKLSHKNSRKSFGTLHIRTCCTHKIKEYQQVH